MSGKDRNWPKDEFGRSEMLAQFWWLFSIFGIALMLGLVELTYRFVGKKQNQVVVYCAQDRFYAEPIFRDLEKTAGIKVRAVYDSEAVKTVGLANRLLAERSHPQCDVFWGNEEIGYRSRRMVINTNQLSVASAPHSLIDLTNETWRGKIALAYPQFGTTATHFHALRQHWGDDAWQIWCRALASNKPFLVDGNSVVVKVVAKGEAWIGLTDSDDIADGQREGLPIAACPMNSESLLIPMDLVWKFGLESRL